MDDQELDGLYARLRDAEDARQAAVAVIQRQNKKLAALKAALKAELAEQPALDA
jgi:DNA-binding MarR family transcriptional regulator